MGGKVFSPGDNPLLTPRMPQRVYLSVQRRYEEVLRTYFTYVVTPIEAPEKKDFGDVDFLVAGLAATFQGQDIEEVISKALGAERHQADSYAVPWPEDIETIDRPGQSDELDHETKRFIQIDVNVYQDQAAFEWAEFQHAHGDMWNMIGSITRKLGLTADSRGFHIRIKEMEPIDRKKSMVFLSQKPAVVLGFLGLNEERYARPFDTLQELFEYVASCRFFHADDVLKDTPEDKRELKHNDRKRMKKRPQFVMWIEQFIPAYRTASTYNQVPWTRNQICDEVFRYFGVQDEFEQKLDQFRKGRQRDEIWQVAIRKGVPKDGVDPGIRAAALRALRSIIIDGDRSLGITPATALENEDGFYDMDEVVKFIQENWQQIGNAEFVAQQTRAIEMDKLKRDQRRNEQGNRHVIKDT